VKDAEANEQHKAAAPKWEFEQIKFVVGNRGSVVESDFYTKVKKLDLQEGENYKLFADHVTQAYVMRHIPRWCVSDLIHADLIHATVAEWLRANRLFA